MCRSRIAALAALLTLALPPGLSPAADGVILKDVTLESGLVFQHNIGLSGEKFLAETFGSGAALFDYDMDGDLDIYMENGGALPGYKGSAEFTRGLFRNEGGMRFTEVLEGSGIDNQAYGMGVCVGDYDNDGYPDLYVVNFGENLLFHNQGDGSFRNVAREAGVTHERFGSSCTFFDADQDGDLDLMAVNYVDNTLMNNKFCGDVVGKVRAYCTPQIYNSERDIFYLNNGDGTFTDAGREMGISEKGGNGLGITVGDFDDDGDPDVFVANDETPNNLYRNDGGRFVDVGLLSGVAYDLGGETQAGMGTDFGDFDGDGDLDLAVTNYDVEYNALYRNEGGGFFSDASFASGVGGRSLNYLGFGIKFLDYDNDGLQDILIANGHIVDNIAYFNDSVTYAQRNFVHHNLGNGKFEEVGLSLGPDMAVKNVSRALVTGDVDRDGDLDLLFTVCGGKPRILRNDGGNSRPAVRVRLVGTESNRSAIGARGVLTVGERRLLREVQGGTAYQSQSEFTLHFGLGDAKKGDLLEVRWPSGRKERIRDPKPGDYILVEGEGKLRP